MGTSVPQVKMLSWLGIGKSSSLNGIVPKFPNPSHDDDRWESVGHVSNLNLYPMKSSKANRLQSAKVERFGLTDEYGNRDRQFMVINSKNLMVTGRQQTKLVLVQVSVVPGFEQVKFSAPDMDDLFVDLPDVMRDESGPINVVVFGDHTDGYDLGPEMSDWISSYLAKGSDQTNRSYRVIYHPYDPQTRPRNTRQNERVTLNNMGPDDTCLYADVAAFMAATTASIDGLNQKLQGRLQVDSFFCRPNIVIDNSQSGGEPFDEDTWLFVKIGQNVVFRIINWSDRCIFTTIDPYTAIKNPLMEPLKTLRTFRCWKDVAGDSPFFGVNLGIDDPNGDVIKVGDEVKVIRIKSQSHENLSMALTYTALALSLSLAIVTMKYWK